MGGTGAVKTSCGRARSVTSEEPRSGAGTPCQSWPMQSHLDLAALPTAPACARGHVRVMAYEWGLPEVADTAELLVSELVTNAVQASARLRLVRQAVVRLWLACDRYSVVIHVWDGNDDMPESRDAAPDAERGRGLMLVEALSKDWGAYRAGNGKVVWVQIE
jgi:anti-sigma regulatory factor (Ser/Thr protein kinase)